MGTAGATTELANHRLGRQVISKNSIQKGDSRPVPPQFHRHGSCVEQGVRGKRDGWRKTRDGRGGVGSRRESIPGGAAPLPDEHGPRESRASNSRSIEGRRKGPASVGWRFFFLIFHNPCTAGASDGQRVIGWGQYRKAQFLFFSFACIHRHTPGSRPSTNERAKMHRVGVETPRPSPCSP